MIKGGHARSGLPRCAIVTGGASGIGYATVAALLSENWSVVVLDRDDAALEVVRRELSASGHLSAHRVDLTQTSDVERIIFSLPPTVSLDGLVCCASVGGNQSFLETSLASIRSLFEINFMATFALCQLVARRMMEQGGGSIVNITSVSGFRANAGRAAYGSSKAALEMLSKIMAVELAPHNIRVNTLAPGPTSTPMAAAMHAGVERQRLLSSVPQGRYGSPDEIAQGVVFLLDDQRSGYVTGSTLFVDGGMCAAGSFEPVHAACQ